MTAPITYYFQYLITKKMIMIFLFGMSFLSVWSHPPTNKFSIKNVVIYGESNISDFQLKYEDSGSGNLESTHKHKVFENEEIQNLFEFEIDNFKTANRRISHDFKQMLQSDSNPTIRIQFDENFCQSKNKNDEQLFDVLIKIGGVERQVKVECIAQGNSEKTQLFLGKSVILLSDFGLVPPRHIFGLIKVEESIMITFEVQVFSNK
jgi:hypothetical protein